MNPKSLWAKKCTWKVTVNDGWSSWNDIWEASRQADASKALRRKVRRQVLRKLTYEERVANVLSDGMVLQDKMEDAIAAQIG